MKTVLSFSRSFLGSFKKTNLFTSKVLIVLALVLTSNIALSQKTGEVPKGYAIKKEPKISNIILQDKKIVEQKSIANISSINALVFSNNVDYNHTGALQTFTVPCGVTQIYVTALGAQGGTGAVGGNAASGGLGGKGSAVTGYLSVTPGQVINIFVGGAGGTALGGYNGGGTGGSQNGGGGGGASDIRYPGTSATDRKLVAGGGGGGGRAGCESVTVNGGAGGNGDNNGANGNNAPTSGGLAGGGAGAIGSNFGAKGIGCDGFLGVDGTSGNGLGIGGNGGAGQSCCCFSFASIPGGGGGGGGFIGGGGGGGGSAGTVACGGNDKGAGGGGAGGISYFGAIGLGKLITGVKTGNGKVTISYEINSSVLNDTITYVQPNCAVVSSFSLNPEITINSSLVATDSTQLNRVFRNTVPSICAAQKVFPGIFNTSGLRHFKAFYLANSSGATQCFEVLLNTTDTRLHYVTYINKFNPNNVDVNYLGDLGSSGLLKYTGQNVPSGDTMVIVVHEVNVNDGLSIPFQLKIKGAKNLEYSANDGATWQGSQTFAGLGAGDFTTKVRFEGSTCYSNLLNFQTVTSNLNLVTDFTNNILFKLSTSTITATNKILSPSEIYYIAGKSISLNPGFESANGSLFRASIGGCN